jgi:hypothetical protein
MTSRTVISIDIGVLNLGVVGAKITDSYTLESVFLCEKYDLTDHGSISMADLHLCVKTFFEKESVLFEEASYVLLERQPPMGLMVVQELFRLILINFPAKVVLISPSTMHSFYDIGHLDYENRKKAVVRIANSKLGSFLAFKDHSRKHDMADAFCFLKVFLEKQNDKYTQLQMKLRWKKQNRVFLGNMAQFFYNGE